MTNSIYINDVEWRVGDLVVFCDAVTPQGLAKIVSFDNQKLLLKAIIPEYNYTIWRNISHVRKLTPMETVAFILEN